MTVTVDIRRTPVQCKVWKCDNFGTAALYLLDRNRGRLVTSTPLPEEVRERAPAFAEA